MPWYTGRKWESFGIRALMAALEFCLVGDSSLYTKKGNGKPSKIESALRSELQATVRVVSFPGGGIRDILTHVSTSRFECETLGISYFGNEHPGTFDWAIIFASFLQLQKQRICFFAVNLCRGLSRKTNLQRNPLTESAFVMSFCAPIFCLLLVDPLLGTPKML